jgi:hypothetical protein
MISFVDISGSAATNRAAAQSYLLTSLTSGVWKQAERKDFSAEQRSRSLIATPAQGNYLQVGKNPSKKIPIFHLAKAECCKNNRLPTQATWHVTCLSYAESRSHRGQMGQNGVQGGVDHY